MKEASFYEKQPEKHVHCYLCRQHCGIAPGKRGLCGVRENRDGTLYSLIYEYPCATHVDPIEKKPLFHFLPGSKAFSIATAGCNFHCRHCQNSDISQISDKGCALGGERVSAGEVVNYALQTGCRSISYTYTEPTIFYEYAFDIARLAAEKGLYNNFVTNGYIEDAPLEQIRPYLHGANIDLKGFNENFYGRVCKAKLSGVLDTIRSYKRLNIWIELTTLIIPGYNDNMEELKKLAQFIREELGPQVPWHVSGFYPTYKLTDAPPTSSATLKAVREIGLEEGLKYVYEGNVAGSEGEHTYCYNCTKPIIKRLGFTITEYNIKNSACVFCNATIDGIGL
ncbi:MAG TPA: AmmeMemoRadiSam system radical SAM enzyme [Syntrophorhabdaceae bacterium]|nr:AmmeMemoRadiSam system radical SAM enzyme [Syntrophorhabdaceae bacterium]